MVQKRDSIVSPDSFPCIMLSVGSDWGSMGCLGGGLSQMFKNIEVICL